MRQSFRGWAWMWAGWTALAVFFAVSSSLTYLSTGRPANWSLTIARALSEWWLWALLTPIVVRLARRFPLHGPRWRRSLVAHALAGFAVAFAKTIADRASFALMTGFWMYLLASTFALQFVVYAAIVAGAHGLEYYRRSREREQLERRLAETRLQVANAHVPVLLLQPLVENAIRHGLAIRRHAGCVRIEARREAGTLLIAVIDDGPGAAEEAVIGREGIGLGNTRARLNALYGTAHAFELANVPGGGARVSIRLPFRTSAEGVA
jgi:hypothetical protein